MITAEIQIHGYRKGHQLLSSSVVLSKNDQVIVDRLSDVAGPLRPREQFKPYLSAYSLPSGRYYVVARTWQDLTVPRAGCVRTKSVLLDPVAWSKKPPFIPILRLLSSIELPGETEATRIELEDLTNEQFPPSPKFNASELLEALFLEDTKPVVVFDAPDPELIAVRLITALWPDIRRRFALSTFALSPRKIGGRDFDLVFAPSNAKAKFSDLHGRRVEGRTLQTDRHKWTAALVRRVFETPVPRLLFDSEVNLLGDRATDSAAVIRIALLWDELLEKLNQTPTAALGLLDIANSGMVSDEAAVNSLDPRLAEATRMAMFTLPSNDGWEFVGAIVQKMQGHNLPTSWKAVDQLAVHLAENAPSGAISLLQQPDPKGAINNLISSIATGLSNRLEPDVEVMLATAPFDIFARLLAQKGKLSGRVARDDRLIARIGVVLTEVDQEIAHRAGMMLLPFLVEDRQFAAAEPIFARLDAQEIATEMHRLGHANDFQAKRLGAKLIVRAREVGGLRAVRETLILSNPSQQRDVLLAQSLDPVVTDILWLFNETRLSKVTFTGVLSNVLQRADDGQFAALLSDDSIGKQLIAHLPSNAFNLLVHAVIQDALPMSTHVNAILLLIGKVDDAGKLIIAGHVIERCLRNRIDSHQSNVLLVILGILGTKLDGGWAVRTGLSRDIIAEVASRNLIVFDQAPVEARTRIIKSVNKIALALHGRETFDLSEAANEACARLMFDAEITSHAELVEAAGWLMPSLLQARNQPVSLIIAALFPLMYLKLANADEVPDIMKFMPFFDWDRCKTARQELVRAFISSSWKPGDLALTACRCNDVFKILKRVANSLGGEEYLKLIEKDLKRLNEADRRQVKHKIAEIRLERRNNLKSL